MGNAFDPYHKWLGIPPQEQPPNHYRLLGLALFESDPDVIDAAASKQVAYLQGCATGPHVAVSQKLLNEVAAARLCLLHRNRKAAYDKQLGEQSANRGQSGATQPGNQATINEEDRGVDLAGLVFSAAQHHAVRTRHATQAWHIQAGIAAAIVVCIAIAIAIFLLNGGNKDRRGPANVAQAEMQPQPVAAPKKESPPGPAKPRQARKLPPIQQMAPRPLEPKNPKKSPDPPESVDVALEQLQTELAVAKTADDFRAITEKGIRLADRAIMDDNVEKAREITAATLVAARKASDNELVKVATLRVVQLQEPISESVRDEAKSRLRQPIIPDRDVLHMPLVDEPPKQSLPADAALQEATNLFNDVYGKQYSLAKTDRQKYDLAKTLLKKSVETKEPANRYVLLIKAQALATAAGDGPASFEALDEIDLFFQIDAIDATDMKVATLVAIAKKSSLPDDRRFLVEQAIAIYEDAIARDYLRHLLKLANMARSAASKTGDNQLIKLAADCQKEVGEVESAFEAANAAAAGLETEPTDPELNLAVGRYRCLVKADWENGLPMLALGTDEALKALAMQELRGVSDAAEKTKLGDGWRDAAQKETPRARKHALRRAAHWYVSALPGLSGLVRDSVDGRIKEIAEELGDKSAAKPNPPKKQAPSITPPPQGKGAKPAPGAADTSKAPKAKSSKKNAN